jgi:hypothetical protein
MEYLVQINTAAGQITVGTFSTLATARAYLAPIRSGVIVPLFPPHLATARQLIETPTAGQLADILKF